MGLYDIPDIKINNRIFAIDAHGDSMEYKAKSMCGCTYTPPRTVLYATKIISFI